MLGGIFLVLATVKIVLRRFSPALYCAMIVASITAGTTLADHVTHSIGIGYTGGSLLLLGLVLASLLSWRLTIGSVSADHIESPILTKSL